MGPIRHGLVSGAGQNLGHSLGELRREPRVARIIEDPEPIGPCGRYPHCAQAGIANRDSHRKSADVLEQGREVGDVDRSAALGIGVCEILRGRCRRRTWNSSAG
jgi:hypothetical protein